MLECSSCGGEICKHRNTEYKEEEKIHICLDCGKAFRKCEVWSRPVGYLRPSSGFNKGKHQEFVNRKTYKNVSN